MVVWLCEHKEVLTRAGLVAQKCVVCLALSTRPLSRVTVRIILGSGISAVTLGGVSTNHMDRSADRKLIIVRV